MAKVKGEDIEKLEKKCQRMIYEKEEKYLENEHKLKFEYQELQGLESQLLMMELQIKERNQESNLMDIKLREWGRVSQVETSSPGMPQYSGYNIGSAQYDASPSMASYS